MAPKEQTDRLNNIGENFSFSRKLQENGKYPMCADSIEILQINVGRLCNLHCKHCHVEAGPERREVMPLQVFEKCLNMLAKHEIPTIDITGGSPEMNPHLAWFLDEAGKLERRLIVRSNLTLISNPHYSSLIDTFVRNRVEVFTSLPDYNQNKSDRQRGEGVYNQIITAMKILNAHGYGKTGSGLILNIVHNPVGAYLPGPQETLELEYRERLWTNHGVVFNNLYSITNIPVGRYLDYLLQTGNYDDYMTELANAYNPKAVDRAMCRTTLSVGWDGKLYDCDFNQMLELQIDIDTPCSIFEYDMKKLINRKIVIHNHCYGCVAGTGSSCQGTTTVAGKK